MNYKLVIFDFDGTLADTLPWFAGLLNEIADRYGFKRVEPHEYDTLRGFTPKEISEYLGVPLWKAPLIGADLRRRMAHDIDRISLYPGMEQALRELWDGGATLAVVSSNAETNVRTVLGREIAALIDDYECGVSLFGKAPKLRKVIDHTGVGRDETIAESFAGSVEQEKGHGWGLGADYKVNAHTALSADYGYDHAESTANGVQDAHRVTVGVTLSR